MGIKISDMTAGTVAGSEMIPVSAAGLPRRIDPSQIKDYIIAQVEAIAAAVAVDGNDEIMILDSTDSGTLKPVDLDLVAQHAIDTIWGKGAEASPDDADVMALKDGGTTEKTITLAVLAEYVRTTIEAAILNISDLADGSGALTGTDYMLVTQGTDGKYITFQDVINGVYTGLVAHVTGLGSVTSTADADIFYCIQGGSTPKQVTLADIVAHFGTGVTKTGSTTEDYVPQWTANDGEQKNGLAVATGTFDAGLATSLSSTLAVRAELARLVYYSTDIGGALADADAILVDDGNLGTTQRKSTLSRLWTWALAKIVAITDVSTHGWVVDEDTLVSDLDTKVPTQQSVKAYVDAASALSWDGLLTDIDIDGGTDINSALVDADLFIVDDGAVGTNRKCAASRIKTFMQTADVYDTLWVPAKDMTPSTTDGCDTETHEYATQDMNHYVMLFDGLAQDEHAEFDIVMPDSWDLGTVKAKVYWSNGHADANTGEYVEFYLAAGARSDDDALDATLGTIETMEDQLITDDDMHVTEVSDALTVGGTPALGDMVHFRLSRDYDHAGAGVAMDVDARVFGVLIQYKKNVATTLWT